MKLRLLPFLVLLHTFPVAAQQRPLVTERVETVDRGHLLFDFGVEFLQDTEFRLSGLKGDLTRVGVISARFGVGDNVEVRIAGSIQDFLNVDDRFAAPNANILDFSGNSTSDVGDFRLATKIRFNQEHEGTPAFGLDFGMELPNASNESGLGNDETNVFAALLIEKHLNRLRLTGNVGTVILGDPLEPGSQDDLFTYGVAATFAATPKLNLLAEVYGRTGPGGIGTEDRARLRAGVQIRAGGAYWDIAALVGFNDSDPSSGVIIGVSKTINLLK
ncbi:MAG: transporter [Acidobacteriota bacterium]